MLVLDAATVTGPVGGPVTPDNGRVLSAPIALTGCRSAQTLAAGPDRQRHPRGGAVPTRAGTAWARVAVALLEVS